MSIQNQHGYKGPNAKQYSREVNRKALNEAKQVVQGLSAEERALRSSMNYMQSTEIVEEQRRSREIEQRRIRQSRNYKRKHRKLRPQAVALLTAVGLGGVVLGNVAPKIIKGAQFLPKDNSKSYTDGIEPETTQIPVATESAIVESEKTNDEITYIVDFNDFANPDAEITIREMLDSGKVGALILKAGGTGYDYPFAIRNFDEEEIINDMSQYSGEVTLSGNMGKMEDLEKYVQMAADRDIDVGFYYYTCANTYREADMEAAYIKSFYDKLDKDMPNLDSKKILPITIDIEDAGPEREGRGLSFDEIEGIKSRRTDAVRHLVKDLSNNGVIDDAKGVIIYGDINRVAEKTHVNWQDLYDGIETDGTKVIQWGTRALPQTYDNNITYTKTSSLVMDLMNDGTNIQYMKEAYKGKDEFLEKTAIMQIHLDEEITNGPNWAQMYDISATTKDTLKAIEDGTEINYGEGFVEKMEKLYNGDKTEELSPTEMTYTEDYSR